MKLSSLYIQNSCESDHKKCAKQIIIIKTKTGNKMMGQNGWRKLLENMNTAANKMNANWRATKMEWKRHVYPLTNCFELKWNSHDKCSNAKDSSKNSSTGISFFEMNLQERVNIRAKNEKNKKWNKNKKHSRNKSMQNV